MTRDEEKKNQAAASTLLVEHWNAWCDAHEICAAAKRKYEQRARTLGIQLCDGCNKPMPEYDSSQYCDGCNLPWGGTRAKGNMHCAPPDSTPRSPSSNKKGPS